MFLHYILCVCKVQFLEAMALQRMERHQQVPVKAQVTGSSKQ